LGGIIPLSLGDEITFRDPATHQVIAANATLAEPRIGSSTSGRNDNRCDTLRKKIEGVIQASTEHGGRVSGVLRRTKHHNGICRRGLFQPGLANNPDAGYSEKGCHGRCHQGHEP